MSDKKISELPPLEVLDPNAIVPVSQPDPASNILKTFGAKASQFITGISTNSQSGYLLLGKLTGANMNLSTMGTLNYDNPTGFPFQIGDSVFDSNGSSGSIATLEPSKQAITMSGKDIKGTIFSEGDTISGQIGEIKYSPISGSLGITGKITGESSGANGSIYSNDSISIINVYLNSGSFTEGETITADNGATATVTSYIHPATASVVSFNYTGKQTITLSGGSKFLIKDIVITNASTALSNTAGVNFTDSLGNPFFTDQIFDISTMTTPTNYINFQEGSKSDAAPNTLTSPIYFGLDTAQGSPATADIYVYGYVIE